MDSFNEELAIAEMACAMRTQFGSRAIEIAEEQARGAETAHVEKVWRRIALKLRRWDAVKTDGDSPASP
jgi:hypothetical protein